MAQQRLERDHVLHEGEFWQPHSSIGSGGFHLLAMIQTGIRQSLSRDHLHAVEKTCFLHYYSTDLQLEQKLCKAKRLHLETLLNRLNIVDRWFTGKLGWSSMSWPPRLTQEMKTFALEKDKALPREHHRQFNFKKRKRNVRGYRQPGPLTPLMRQWEKQWRALKAWRGSRGQLRLITVTAGAFHSSAAATYSMTTTGSHTARH